jgi:hypothetical protein
MTLSITLFSIITPSITVLFATLFISAFVITTIFKVTLSITRLSIMTLSITRLIR